MAAARDAQRLGEHLAASHPQIPQAASHIRIAGLSRFDANAGRLREPRSVSGFSCTLAVAGVAHPELVFAQLEDAGATVRAARAFSDHHRYSAAELAEISRRSSDGPLVATLKDAVKLGPRLGPGADIYVPVQELVWESGADRVERLLTDLQGVGEA